MGDEFCHKRGNSPVSIPIEKNIFTEKIRIFKML